MTKIVSNIPNYLTLGNLFCGALGIERVFAGHPEHAFLLMLIAAVLDFFDGFLARLLKADGEMGRQLDSMADMVSFGVLPAVIWYHFIMQYMYCTDDLICSNRYAWVPLVLGAGWRLAKFNVDSRQGTGFHGVPTPITGIALGSIAFSHYFDTWLLPVYTNFYVMMFAPTVAAMLMVSDIPMLALKFKKGDPQNRIKWIFLGVSVVILAYFGWDSPPLIYVFYILLSVLANFVTKKKT